MTGIGLSVIKAPEPTHPTDVNKGKQVSKTQGRSHVLYVVAISLLLLVVVSAVVCGVYVGYKVTKHSYEESNVLFKDKDDGTVIPETVRIKDTKAEFDAIGKFSVLFDYEKMLVVIRPTVDIGDRCYVGNLYSKEMGTIDDVTKTVKDAKENDGIANVRYEEVEFVESGRSADVETITLNGNDICGGVQKIWLARQRNNLGAGGLVRNKRCTVKIKIKVGKTKIKIKKKC